MTGGIGTFVPRTLPCGEEFLGRGLSYFVHDPAELAGRRVLVVGGGDSAFDWADALSARPRSPSSTAATPSGPTATPSTGY